MAKYTLSGASDDLIEFDGPNAPGEINVICDGEYFGTIEIGTLKIHVIYDGHWAFAIGPTNDDCDKWPHGYEVKREWGTVCQYSETLTIECPDGVPIKYNGKIALARVEDNE